MKIVILTTISLFLLPVTVLAQLTAELDSIDVTASRITSTISESGKSVTVISRQEIEAMPVTSVDELMRSIPGVNINSRQGFGVQADVGMRGSTFSQVLFMLDNVPLNDPLTAHFNANIPVSLAEIGQIEIIRGPASASYGADAVGGVVHIKTKMYMERDVDTPGGTLSHATADVAAGQNNLKIGDFSFELQNDRLRWSTSLRSVSSDGERLENPGYEAGASDEPHYDNYFELFNLSSSLTYRISDSWSWYLRGGYDDRDFSARYFYTRSEFDESVEQITNRWGLTALTRDSGSHRTEINASYREVNDIFDFNSRIGIPANEHTTGLLFLNASHQIDTGNLNSSAVATSRVMIGGQYTNKQIESTDRGDHNDSMGGIYLIGSAGFTNGLNLTASSRVEFHTRNRAEFLPQLSVAYNTNRFTLRSSVGRAIRVGDFTERYISSQIPDLAPMRNIGNPDLEPERSYTFDAGIDWRATSNTIISQTFFYRSSTNLIDYAIVNSSDIDNADNLQEDADYFYSLNIANSSVSGVEISASQNIRFANRRTLSLDAGYTYIHTTSDGEEVSKYIANHPSHQLSLTAAMRIGGIQITPEASYRVRSAEEAELVGGRVPDSYVVANLKVQYTPDRYPVTLYTQILNLTDTQYQEILGAPMPGRWAMGGIRVAL